MQGRQHFHARAYTGNSVTSAPWLRHNTPQRFQKLLKKMRYITCELIWPLNGQGQPNHHNCQPNPTYIVAVMQSDIKKKNSYETLTQGVSWQNNSFYLVDHMACGAAISLAPSQGKNFLRLSQFLMKHVINNCIRIICGGFIKTLFSISTFRGR